MSELKHCPCCGGKASLYTGAFFTSVAQVRCKQCGIRTMEYKSASPEDAKLQAIAAWNRREGGESECPEKKR